MKKNIYLMYFIALLQGMVFYGPIATLYRQAHGLTFFHITLIESLSFALCILLEMPWGIVADKIGYRKTMIFCCTLYFLSKIVFWQVTGFSGFLLERIMLSVVESGFSGVDSSILYLSCNQQESQKVFGIYNGMGMAGLLSASLIFTVFIQDHYGLSAFLTTISYGISAILSFFLTEVKSASHLHIDMKPVWSEFKNTMIKRKFFLFLIATALFTEAHQMITVFLNQVQYTLAGFGNSEIGILYIIMTALGMCGALSHFFTKKAGIRFSIFLLCLIATVCSIIPALFPFRIPSAFSILLLRFSNTLFQPIQMDIQNRQICSENRATFLSMNAMVTSFIAILTNIVFGLLSEISVATPLIFGSGICLTSLSLFFFWFRYSSGNMEKH